MYIPGHLSAGYLLVSATARWGGRRPPLLFAEVLPVLVGTLTPDIIDKGLLYLEITDHGRTIGHSVFTLMALSAAAAVLFLVHRGAGKVMGFWLLGIGAHMATDLVDDAVRGVLHGRQLLSSWFLWPFLDASAWNLESAWEVFPGSRLYMALEVAVVIGAVVVAGFHVWGKLGTGGEGGK